MRCALASAAAILAPLLTVLEAESTPRNAGTSQANHCRVDFIGGLSGPGSVYAVAPRRAIELALADIGETAGISFQFHDDEFLPRKTAAAFHAIEQQGGAYAVTVIGATPALSIAPLAERARIPLIAVASDTRISSKRDWVLRAWASGEDEGAFMVKEARRRGVHAPSILHDTDDFSRSVADGFEAASAEPRFREELPSEATDFRSLLARLKGLSDRVSRTDGLALCMSAGQVGLVARQIRALGWEIPLFGCVTMENAAELQVARGALQGAWFVTSSVQPAFAERYLARYGDSNFLGGAAMFYDLTRILNEACKRNIPGHELIAHMLHVPLAPQALKGLRAKVEVNDKALVPELTVREVGGLEQ